MLTWLEEAIATNDRHLRRALAVCDLESRVPDDVDQLLEVARKKINVFPFHKVESRWLQLFVNLNIKKALRALSSSSWPDISPDNIDDWDAQFTRAVECLDNALIIAGGQDRRDSIDDIFEHISEALPTKKQVTSSPDDERPSKRLRTDSTVNDEAKLPNQLSFVPQITRVVRSLSQPSLEAFQKHIWQQRRPVKLLRILENWPALSKWPRIKFWKDTTLGGRRLVPVEIGQSYNDEEWRQEIMPFKRFLNEYIISNTSNEVGYLAQHDLITQIPALRNDILVPDYCYCDTPPADERRSADKSEHPSQEHAESEPESEIHQNIWFGGRTVSPLHHDPYHNILCQVHGTKYIRLYSPEHTARLHPRSKVEAAPHADGKTPATIDMSNNSAVDIYAIELSPHEDWDETWPGISKVPYVDSLLEAGEALYIPRGWWHYVRSVSASGISVSFWW